MIQRKLLYEENKQCDEGGYLSFDLGYKHMCAAYTLDFQQFDIFLFDMDVNSKFQDRLKQLKLNIKQIISIIGSDENVDEESFQLGKSKIKCVIIEEQVQTNIQALNLMYAIGMFFDIHHIQYCIQPARLKYKFFEDRDKRQFKNLSAQYLGERLDQVKLKYQNYDVKTFQNHRWMSDNLRQWLLENKIDKADDIGDVILLLKYYGENMEKIRKQKNKIQ